MTPQTSSRSYGRRRTDRPQVQGKAMDVKKLGIARVILAELDLGLAVRVAVSVLLYIVRLRMDSKALSHERAGTLRQGIIDLMERLIAEDPAVAAAHPAAPAAAIQPVRASAAPQPAPAVRPAPREVPLWNAVKPQGLLIADVNKTSLQDLTISELRQFVKAACNDTKPIFEQALLDAYRRELLSTFCGSFTVKQNNDDHYAPEFLVLYRSGQTAVLKKPANGERPLYAGAYDMIAEHWRHQKRPTHFRIETRGKQSPAALVSA